MCYRCLICGFVTGPGLPRRVHIVYRTVAAHRVPLSATPSRPEYPPGYEAGSRYADDNRKTRQEIAYEMPVCRRCGDAMDVYGMTLAQCRARWGAPRDVVSIKSPQAQAPRKSLVVGKPVDLWGRVVGGGGPGK